MIENSEFIQQAQMSLGLDPRFQADTKFGEAPSGVQTTRTSVWDRADAVPTQQLWLPPTASRIHSIVSTSQNDGNAAGDDSGALTVRIWGVSNWKQADLETSETIVMNGTSAVNTVNSYVCIHRMRVTSAGSIHDAVGTISATAAVDGTVTAVIRPLRGSSHMAIRAVPAGWRCMIYQWYAQIDKASGSAASCEFDLEDWDFADSDTNYVKNVRDVIGVQSTGSSSHQKDYPFPLRFTGPCVVHISATASTADVDGEASFTSLFMKG